jgi:hypothetical protein
MMSIISPKAGLTIVKKTIEKTLKKKIEKFDIVYNAKKNLILFRLYNYTDTDGSFHDSILKKYTDNSGLAGFISKRLAKETKEGENIDMAIISYEKLTCELFITKNDVRTAKMIKL